MREDTKTIIFCSIYLMILLMFINLAFYSLYELPFGMLDVDGYLYHSGDPDPRLNHVNKGHRMILIDRWDYKIFYSLLDLFGNPRITFLWLPPLLLTVLILQIYWIYQEKGSHALNETIMIVCMTYAIPFFFTAALYRQLLGMVLLLAGYNLIIRDRKIIGYVLIITGFLTHIHLAPIAALYVLADRIYKKRWLHTAALMIIATAIALNTRIVLAISPLLPTPQPGLYMQLFTITNPILLIYALKRPKWDFLHILLVILIISMPLTDQSRGLIFLHIILVTIAYQKYMQEDTPRYYYIILVILSFLWYTNLLNFLVRSMIQDGVERNLDLMPIMNYLTTHRIN